jgi:serine protease Do
VARLGAVGVAEGQDVFVSGWPAPDATGQLVRQFTNGGVSALLDQPIMGYQIAYTNVTRPGMSGSPVFDTGGRVVGIHGWGGYEDPAQIASVFGMNEDAAANIMRLFKSGFNYAIPINVYLQQAPQANVYLNVQVDSTPAQGLEQPYVASNEPDKRDVIEDINGVMNIIGKAGAIICGIFGC